MLAIEDGELAARLTEKRKEAEETVLAKNRKIEGQFNK